MTTPVFSDAFAHHTWATIRLIDACGRLTDEQLATAVPGTYGSILDTMRHLVAADAGYLHALTDGRFAVIEPETLDFDALRTEMERHRPAWSAILAAEPDPDQVVTRRRADGSTTQAPIGIRLAQAVHHGTDHRSQICTALTSLGITPPDIDAWDFAASDGRLVETPPTA
jgi:uncharacterized damage-inducible protein DinB